MYFQNELLLLYTDEQASNVAKKKLKRVAVKRRDFCVDNDALKWEKKKHKQKNLYDPFRLAALTPALIRQLKNSFLTVL